MKSIREKDMKVGIPRGLLYDQYHPFFTRFFTELGAELAVSPPTNRAILDAGIQCCVDEACLPVKVFHGHVSCLKAQCDLLFIPRIMRLYRGEYICPKFCGLPEMVLNSIYGLPETITEPFYADSMAGLRKWALRAGARITRDRRRIKAALEAAIAEQLRFKTGYDDQGYPIRVALAGHPYNLYDTFINMNVRKKLNQLGIGVVTEESADEEEMAPEVAALFKKPFWTFARKTYGFIAASVARGRVQGVVYISSFACGIDSVILELVRDRIGDFPMLVLKIDEHTGEAGVDTRIEAFADMLERSGRVEDHHSPHGQRLSCCESPV